MNARCSERSASRWLYSEGALLSFGVGSGL